MTRLMTVRFRNGATAGNAKPCVKNRSAQTQTTPRRKKMSKSLHPLGLFLCLTLVGCASAPKLASAPVPVADPAVLECRTACDVMAVCASKQGGAWSRDDVMTCNMQCMSTHPVLRASVATCATKVLSSSCDPRQMEQCVRVEVEKRRRR